MSTLSPKAATDAINLRVQTALGSNWKYVTGEPLSYIPPQASTFWRGVPALPQPLEIVDVQHEFTVRLIAQAAEPRDALDLLSDGWVALRDAWKQKDNIALGGLCQESWWSSIQRVTVHEHNDTHSGFDFNLSVIDKTPDTFT